MKLPKQVQLSRCLGDKHPVMSRRGMTLVELLVAVAIGSMVMTAAGMLFLYSSKSFAAISNYIDLDMNSRNTLDHMTKEIRQMAALTSFQTNELTFVDKDGETLKVSWSPVTREFTRERPIGATPEVLLRSCESLRFQMFQRHPQPGTNNFTATTDLAQCKMISVNWKCSRVLQGKQLNTESVQTTQIVLRNKP